MKIILALLIIKVISTCTHHTLSNCLNDEECQITIMGCETRPNECKNIDASNPNNCSGSKCYYNFILKVCEEYEQTDRLLEDRRHDEQSENHQNNNQEQNQQNQQPNTNTQENSETNTTPKTPTTTDTITNSTDTSTPNNSTYVTNTTTITNTTNATNTTTETNTTTVTNTTTETSSPDTTTETTNTTTTTSDSTTEDTVVFEIIDLHVNIDQLIESRDSEKELKVVTSFSMALVTFLILY